MRSEPTVDGELCTVSASQVELAAVGWLVPARVPLGKITLLDGDPGLGKSTLLLDWAARLSSGRAMPAGPKDAAALAPLRADVTVLTAEDSLQDTVLPRLKAAGADLERVHFVTAVRDGGEGVTRPPVLPRDLNLLEAMVQRTDSRLLLVDPLTAYLGGGVDVSREQAVRRCLHRLSGLAERTGAAVLLLRHLTKQRGRALYRGGGTIGLIAAARSGLLVGRDPDGPDEPLHGVLATTKSNLCAAPPSLRYRLEQAGPPGVCRVVWGGTSSLTADDLLVQKPAAPDDRGALAEAEELLRGLLQGGRQTANACEVEAVLNGVSPVTLRRAKGRLGVESVRDGTGFWWWKLPGEPAGAGQDDLPSGAVQP